jgi:hypothetical protein
MTFGPFDRVLPGDPLRISAGAYNSFVDAAKEHVLSRGRASQTPASSLIGAPGLIRVKNGSGSPVGAFDVLAISGVSFSHSGSSDAFQYEQIFTGDTPSADDEGVFCVCQEPIPDSSSVGLAVVSGMTPVRVYVRSTDHMAVDVDSGIYTYTGSYSTRDYLESRPSGSGRIITSPGSTGYQWCWVNLGSPVAQKDVVFKITASSKNGSFSARICTNEFLAGSGLWSLNSNDTSTYTLYSAGLRCGWLAADDYVFARKYYDYDADGIESNSYWVIVGTPMLPDGDDDYDVLHWDESTDHRYETTTRLRTY